VFGKNLDVFFDFWWVLALFYQFLVKKLGLFFRSQKCVLGKICTCFPTFGGFWPCFTDFWAKNLVCILGRKNAFWEKSGRVFRLLVGFGPVLPVFGQKTWSIF